MYPYQHKILKTFLEYKVTFIVQKVAFIYIMSYWCIFIIFRVIFNLYLGEKMSRVGTVVVSSCPDSEFIKFGGGSIFFLVNFLGLGK